MNRLVPMAAIAAACATSPLRQAAGPAGTYDLSSPCVAASCDREEVHRTLVLLESAAPARSDGAAIYECSQEQGLQFAGCIVAGEPGSKPRWIAWNVHGDEIQVGISCGPDGGDQLLFRRDGSKAVWRTGLCCEVDPSGEITGHFGDTTYALKRVGGPAPERCR